MVFADGIPPLDGEKFFTSEGAEGLVLAAATNGKSKPVSREVNGGLSCI